MDGDHAVATDQRAALETEPHALDPMSYPRRILLAVTGLSPQIVTETLYALAVKPESHPRFVPTEIHLITTSNGRELAFKNLLAERPGWFHRLRSDYNLPAIRFEPDCIHTIAGRDGELLVDIRTPQDNECTADFIAQKVRELSADPLAALHVSLAGGRKTMGFYLGYALSLFARLQDQLSHVLVASPYESHSDFYYPTPESRILPPRGASSLSVDARDATICLAHIPIVSLRDQLPRNLLAGTASFSDTVRAARRVLAPIELVIDVHTRQVRAGGQLVALPPVLFSLLAVLAYRTLRNSPLSSPWKGNPGENDMAWSTEYLEDLSAVYGAAQLPSTFDNKIKDGESRTKVSFGYDYFQQQRSKLRRELEEALGPAAKNYRIEKKPRPGKGRRRGYVLAVPLDCIHFAAIKS